MLLLVASVIGEKVERLYEYVSCMAKGVTRFYCNMSDPVPFCTGPIWQYPMKHVARMTLYGNGYITTSGTKSKGFPIPFAKLKYTVRVY